MIITILILIGLYAFLIEPNRISIKRLNLQSSALKGVRIVFVSDFHFSKFAGKRLDRIVKTVNEQNPDLVIFGGDFVVMHSAKASMNPEKIAKGLSKIEAVYGIYSVLGNHDYYKDGTQIKRALIRNGIHILENNNYKLSIRDKEFYIAGISDMQTTIYSLDKALNGAVNPIILVSHSPDIAPRAFGKTDLILAGHTHGGQVRIPFFGAVIVPSKYGKKFESGFIDNLIYVTRGLGTSVLPIRFNCAPEVVVINYD